jgi:hypothetical protein
MKINKQNEIAFVAFAVLIAAWAAQAGDSNWHHDKSFSRVKPAPLA